MSVPTAECMRDMYVRDYVMYGRMSKGHEKRLKYCNRNERMDVNG